MGSFVELGADPLPRRRDGHGLRAREVVACPLGVHFELADALDSVEAELDADGKLPVHRKEIHDASAAGEVPGPAHRILVAIAGRGELRRDTGGGSVGSPPDVDGRLAETIRPGGAGERSGRGGEDQGRVPGFPPSKDGQGRGAQGQHLGVRGDPCVGVHRGTRKAQDRTALTERRQQHLEVGGRGQEVPVMRGQEHQGPVGFPGPRRRNREPRRPEEAADPADPGFPAGADGGEECFEAGDGPHPRGRLRAHGGLPPPGGGPGSPRESGARLPRRIRCPGLRGRSPLRRPGKW